MTELQVMLQGVFEPSRFLALVRDFIVFEDDGGAADLERGPTRGPGSRTRPSGPRDADAGTAHAGAPRAGR